MSCHKSWFLEGGGSDVCNYLRSRINGRSHDAAMHDLQEEAAFSCSVLRLVSVAVDMRRLRLCFRQWRGTGLNWKKSERKKPCVGARELALLSKPERCREMGCR